MWWAKAKSKFTGKILQFKKQSWSELSLVIKELPTIDVAMTGVAIKCQQQSKIVQMIRHNLDLWIFLQNYQTSPDDLDFHVKLIHRNHILPSQKRLWSSQRFWRSKSAAAWTSPDVSTSACMLSWVSRKPNHRSWESWSS